MLQLDANAVLDTAQCLGRWCGLALRSLSVFLPVFFLLQYARSSCILVYRFLRTCRGGVGSRHGIHM